MSVLSKICRGSTGPIVTFLRGSNVTVLTRAPLGSWYNTPHWGGGFLGPPSLSPKLLDRFSNFKRQSKACQNSDGVTFSHFLCQVKNEVTRGHQRSNGSSSKVKAKVYGKRCHVYSFEDRRKCQRQKALRIDRSNSMFCQNFDFLVFDPQNFKNYFFEKNIR